MTFCFQLIVVAALVVGLDFILVVFLYLPLS
jgi:hypothetical protein